MNGDPITQGQEWRNNWKVLLPGVTGVALCALHNYALGVMIVPLEKDWGWSRAELSAGPLVIAVIGLVIAPILGMALDRFGPRRIALVGVPFYCAALSLVGTSQATFASWIMHWALLGLALMFVLPSVWTMAINGWFDRSRGLALAVALSGTGLCAAIAPAATNALVEAFGWRGAFFGIGLAAFAIVMPLVLLFFRGADKPPQGPGAVETVKTPRFGRRQGFRSPTFLKIAAAACIFTFPSCALTSNGVPVLIGQGFDGATAAGLVGLIGAGSIIGRLFGGVLLDRWDARKVAAGSVMMPIVTVAIFFVAPGNEKLAMLACFTIGLSVGTEYDACSYLAARHFGMQGFGTLFGTISGLLVFCNGIVPLLANSIYDMTRSYDIMLWLAIPLCLLSAIVFLSIPTYPERRVPRG